MTVTPAAPTRARSARTPRTCDRFIPRRAAMDPEISHYNLTKENSPVAGRSPAKAEYMSQLRGAMFGTQQDLGERILAFKHKAPRPPPGHLNAQRVVYSTSHARSEARRMQRGARHVPPKPERILDAPDFVDNYYLNLLDWGAQNVLAIALGNTLYLWNASAASVSEFYRAEQTITSVRWSQCGGYLAVGQADGTTTLWDAASARALRTLPGHRARVSSLAWNEHILSTGSADSSIGNHDVRQRNHLLNTLQRHDGEVCGLRWSPGGDMLASGGNDNLVCLWDVAQPARPLHILTDHVSAVKALAWCPWQADLLATGGGSADRTIRFWRASTGTCLGAVDAQSQVTQLEWSRNSAYRELVSAHGFSENQVVVWRYPELARVADLKGHDDRILHMAVSPDGSTVVTGSPADETIRFWRVWGADAAAEKKAALPVGTVEPAFANFPRMRTIR